MQEEIQKCVELLLEGKVILYPTDTVWGLGCDATNERAVEKIYRIKQRQESKNMLVLLDQIEKLPLYVEHIPLIAWDLLPNVERPTTFIYPSAYNLPQIMIPRDGSIAIRIVRDCFCKRLIQRLNRPLVSTSANISDSPAPAIFSDISEKIMDSVDYIVPLEYNDSTDYKPSRIIRFIDNYNFAVIRE